MSKKCNIWGWGIIVLFVFSSGTIGQNLLQVTHETEGITDFTWSPDGSQVAYIALQNDSSKLFIINADGSNKTLLSNLAWGPVNWKTSSIVFRGHDPAAPDYYDALIKKIDPDGLNETTVIGPDWYSDIILRPDGGWVLYEVAPGGWWHADRCDINGANNITVSHSTLVQQIGWLGSDYIIYSRGDDYNTTCGIHRVNFDGSGHVQLTPETLTNNAIFNGSPNADKILYCDGSTSSWDIWMMDIDGGNKTQMTTDPAHDYLCNSRDNIWGMDWNTFYFVSTRTGHGDIYRMNVYGSGLTQMTWHDSLDYQPILFYGYYSYLAFLSRRDGVANIWTLKLNCPAISVVEDVPHDQGGKVTLKWLAPFLDAEDGEISFYSIWRALPNGIKSKLSISTQKEITREFSGKAYISKTMNGEEYTWEWLANQPAHYFNTYMYTAPTLYDSMSTTDGTHYFMVSAHYSEYEGNQILDSDAASGYSVDNLAPLPPDGFIAGVVNNTVELNWEEATEPDFHFYNVYRNGSQIASTVNNQYTDMDVEIGQSYTYKLNARDVHENLSAFCEEQTLVLTSISNNEYGVPEEFQLAQNFPNPFNPSTTIRYALKNDVQVELIIFNMSGQKVKTLVKAAQSTGFKRVVWNGLDDRGNTVPSGLYIYQLKAGGFVSSHKMLLLK